MAWLDDIIEKAGEDADLGFDTKSLLSSNKKRRRKNNHKHKKQHHYIGLR